MDDDDDDDEYSRQGRRVVGRLVKKREGIGYVDVEGRIGYGDVRRGLEKGGHDKRDDCGKSLRLAIEERWAIKVFVDGVL